VTRRTAALALLALLLAAFALRWHEASSRESVWRDELQDLYLVAADTPVRTRLRHEGHPPLHYLLEGAVHGERALDTDRRRTLPLVFGTLSVLLVALLAGAAFGRRAAVLAGGLATAMPFLVYYSAEIRSYALYGLLAVVQALAFVRFLQRRTFGRAALWGALAAAAALTHYYAFYLVLGGGLFALLRDLSRRNLFCLVAAGTAFVAVFAPWADVFWTHLSHDLQPWYKPRRRPADVFGIFMLPFGKWGLPIAVWAIVASFVRYRSDPDRCSALRGLFWMGFGGALAAVVVQQRVGPSNPRYLIGHLLVLLPLLAASWSALLAARGWRRAAAAGALALALVLQQADAAAWTGRRISAALPAATHVAGHERPDDAIWIVPPIFAVPFLHHYEGGRTPVTPPYETTPRIFDWVDYPKQYRDPERAVRFQEQLRAHLAAGGRVWLVLAGDYPLGREFAEDTTRVTGIAPMIQDDLEQLRRLQRILYDGAEDVYLWHGSPERFHESMTVVLFDPEAER